MKVFPIPTFTPDPEKAEKVAATTQSDNLEALALNPDSYIRVVKPQLLEPGLRPGTDEFLETSAHNFKVLVERKAIRENEAAYWFYRQDLPDGTRFEGWVSGVSSRDYEEGRIRRHENTIRDKEARLARHIGVLKSVAEPVLFAANLPVELSQLAQNSVEKPASLDFSDALGRRHQLWKLNNSNEMAAITNAFQKIPALYIADGHHRSAATCLYLKEKAYSPETNGIMALVLDQKALLIKSFHRIIQVQAPAWKLEETCRIRGWKMERLSEVPSKWQEGSIIGISLEGIFRLQPGTNPEIKGHAALLDVARLESEIFPALFGIENSRVDSRISFVRGDKNLAELEPALKEGKAGWIFMVAPNSMNDIIRVADAGEVMPPKSTWVEPKLMTGMLVMKL